MPSKSDYKKKDGSVGYVLSYQNPDTGKQRREYFSSKKELEIRNKEIETIIFAKKNGWITETLIKKRWSDLKQKYLNHLKNNDNALGAILRVGDVFIAFDKFLNESNPYISKFTMRTIEEYRNIRLVQVNSKATVALELRHLKAVFYFAEKLSWLRKNPVVGVKFPKLDINKVRYLTVAEVNRLLKVLKESGDIEMERIVITYLKTGARRSELLKPNLSWEEIDFDKKQILFNGKGRRKRYLPLNESLLNQFREMLSEDREFPFLYTPDYYSHKIQEYYGQAKIYGATLHSLRKTFGSILIQYGKADIYTVSKLLGHSSVTVTEKYYVDLLDDNLRSSVNALEEIF